MEKVLGIKRHCSPDSIKELLNEFITLNIKYEERYSKLKGNEAKIHKLTEEVSSLNQISKNEENKLVNLKEELSKQTQTLNDLEEEKTSLDNDLDELRKKKEQLKKSKTSKKDEQILEKGKRKFLLYKDFTGIRWDYTVIDKMYKGYACDNKNYIHQFCYRNDIDIKDIKEKLWEEIYNCAISSEKIEDTNKENSIMN